MIFLFFGCAGCGAAAEVAVFEPVAVAFEGDDLGGVDKGTSHPGPLGFTPVRNALKQDQLAICAGLKLV